MAKVKDMSFDPIAMFNRDVRGAPGGAGNSTCRDWSAYFCDCTGTPMAPCLQIMPVFCYSYSRTSSRTHSLARCQARSSPACLMSEMMVMVPNHAISGQRHHRS
jgi:hypothetical protein